MGAMDFHNSATVKDGESTSEVFERMHDNACYEYGHGGYSGTLAEKPGFATFRVNAGVTIFDLINALEDEDRDLLAGMLQSPNSNLDGMLEIYSDKWGPAVHVVIEGTHHFFGYASS